MPENLSIVEIQVGPQGRVVIPVALRQAWQVKPGETLMARLEDDRLIFEKPVHIMARVRDRFAALAGQASLADELIAERHQEAARENGS
jgi:bifunctional DNA-binding transcriptional regulator/antitoxin component of YhaV-PrlF toxin-antitoxin module